MWEKYIPTSVFSPVKFDRASRSLVSPFVTNNTILSCVIQKSIFVEIENKWSSKSGQL